MNHERNYIPSLYRTSNVTGRHRGPKRTLGAGYRAPSLQRRAMCRQSCLPIGGRLLLRTSYFHRRVLYPALSLRYACIWSLDIIPTQVTFVQNFVSSAASVAEPAHGENRVLNESLSHSHSSSLFDARESKLSLRKIGLYIVVCLLCTYEYWK